jgi:uncharacterized integral membrane protein (TIGR02327 family)
MDYVDQMNNSLGISGVLNIFIALMCIGFSWWALQGIKLEVLFKHPKGPQAKLLQIFLSVALGYQLARFIIDYLQWSTWLGGMF